MDEMRRNAGERIAPVYGHLGTCLTLCCFKYFLCEGEEEIINLFV